MSLVGQIDAQIRLTHTLDTAELSTPTDEPISPSLWGTWAVTDGTGANQADLLWHDQRTLGATTSEDLDLAGSLTDVYGATLTFARIKGLYVKAADANGANIVVGGAAANAWIGFFNATTDKFKLTPGAFSLNIAPGATAWPVVAGTGDILKIENTDGSAATYDILIMGASA